MLIGQRCFVTVQLHIEVRIIIYVKSILLYKEERVQASVAYVSRSPLIVKVYRSVYQAYYLKVFHLEILQPILVILVRYLDVIADMETFVSDAVGIQDALIHILRQSSLRDLQSVDVLRQGYRLESARVTASRPRDHIYLYGSFGSFYVIPGFR